MKYCKKCGQEIGKNKFCAYCGHKCKNRHSKVIKVIVAVSLCISVIAVGVFGVLRFANKDEAIDIHSDYVFLTEGFTDVKITDEKSAMKAVASVSNVLGISDVEKELEVTSINKRGTETYYRLQQYYNNIPVFGRNIAIVADKNGESLGLTANYSPINEVDTSQSLNEEEIIEKIDKAYGGADSQTNNGLVIYALYGSSPTLAYDVTVYKSNENEVINEQCIISAKNGDVLFKNNLIRTDIEHSLDEYTYKVSDKTYLMYDESRNILVLNSNKKLLDYKIIDKDNAEYLAVSNDGKTNENDNPLWDKNQTLLCGDIKIEGAGKAKWKDDAVDLINSIENTYDFYSKILNWNGYDNKNSPMLSSYNDFFYSKGNNAYSQGNLLVFGYEKDLRDVGLIGHEFAHSVEGSISGMIYSGESGAIMEAYSDIFGELAEDYAKDGILNGDCDWIHGSRNMLNPSVNNYPASYMDDNWKSTVDTGSDSDNGNVHTNNTVISHAAYLMSSGFKGNAKIDNKALATMWFNALNIIQRDSDLSQCRNAVELSARIMLKNEQLTEEQYKTVKTAFDEVGIENATFTYHNTVKNKFDLSVLSVEGKEKVSCKLTVVKMVTPESGPRLIMDDVVITGLETLELEDGSYCLSITDKIDNKDSQTINIKIVVDGNDSDATDEVIVYTDFTDVITVILDEESSKINDTEKYISGDYLIEIDGKIICAKSDGIYYKENIESEEKKISNKSNVVSMLSDGKTVYYVEGEENFAEKFAPKKIFTSTIDGGKSEIICTSKGYVDIITYENESLYYLDIVKNNSLYQYSLIQYNIKTNTSKNILGQWSGDIPLYWVNDAYRIEDKLFVSMNNSLYSYDLITDEYEKLIDSNDGVICDLIDDKVCYEYTEANKRYIALVDSNNNIQKSVPIPENMSLQIVDYCGEFALLFSAFDSDSEDSMFDLYKMNLKTGDIITTKNEVGRYKYKNYLVMRDIINPEDIYFGYNIGLYDKNSNRIINKYCDEFEINITKPMWIIDGYVVDWNLNTYKIYDESIENVNESNVEEISSEEMGKIVYEFTKGDLVTPSEYVKYNGKAYRLYEICRKVEDGDERFHYSHIGYAIISLDGTDVRNVDYINGQIQEY